MTKYLISFPSSAMQVAQEEFQAVADAAHAVIEEAKVAGVYVFGGGINEGVAPVKVSAGGEVAAGTYAEIPVAIRAVRHATFHCVTACPPVHDLGSRYQEVPTALDPERPCGTQSASDLTP